MVVVVFLLLIVALYGYLIKKILDRGQKKWLFAVFFALAVKIGAIIYMIANAPV